MCDKKIFCVALFLLVIFYFKFSFSSFSNHRIMFLAKKTGSPCSHEKEALYFEEEIYKHVGMKNLFELLKQNKKFDSLPKIVIELSDEWALLENQIENLEVKEQMDTKVLTALFINFLEKFKVHTREFVLVINVLVEKKVTPKQILALGDCDFGEYFKTAERSLDEECFETLKEVVEFFEEVKAKEIRNSTVTIQTAVKEPFEQFSQLEHSENIKLFKDFCESQNAEAEAAATTFDEKNTPETEKQKLTEFLYSIKLKTNLDDIKFRKVVKKFDTFHRSFKVSDFNIKSDRKPEKHMDIQQIRLNSFVNHILKDLEQEERNNFKNYLVDQINEMFKHPTKTNVLSQCEPHECRICREISSASKTNSCYRGCLNLYKEEINRVRLKISEKIKESYLDAPIPKNDDSKKRKGSDMKTSNPKKKQIKTQNDGTSAIVIRNVQPVMQNQRYPIGSFPLIQQVIPHSQYGFNLIQRNQGTSGQTDSPFRHFPIQNWQQKPVLSQGQLNANNQQNFVQRTSTQNQNVQQNENEQCSTRVDQSLDSGTNALTKVFKEESELKLDLDQFDFFSENDDSKKRKGSDMETSNPKKKQIESQNDGTSAIVIRNVQSVMQNQHYPTQVDQPFYSNTDTLTEHFFQEESQFDYSFIFL
jgi:hypothetical protein